MFEVFRNFQTELLFQRQNSSTAPNYCNVVDVQDLCFISQLNVANNIPDTPPIESMSKLLMSAILLFASATQASILVISPSLYTSSPSGSPETSSADFVDRGMLELASAMSHITEADLSAVPHQQLLALATNFLTNPEIDVTAEGTRPAVLSFESAKNMDAGKLKHRLANEVESFLDSWSSMLPEDGYVLPQDE